MNLIVTRADDNIQYYSPITHNLLKLYAKKCNADFKILDGEPVVWTKENPPRPHFRIMELYKFLDEYDRILCIDSDVIINKGCPNIFDVVPIDSIGTVREDIGPNAECCIEKIECIQKKFTDIGWKTGYINTGVFVVSKMHKEIFTSINGKYWTGPGSDDIHIGYRIKQLGFKVHYFDFKWNHMSMFSASWNGNADKFQSYIIHYAGGYAAKIRISDDVVKIYGTKEPKEI